MMPSRQLQVGQLKCHFDETIDRHAEAYLAAYPEVREFSNFIKSGTINYYIGMVWSPEYERIDERRVRIRGSMSLTQNNMVELDLSNTDQLFSLFPGQIVAFSADPFVGKRLIVRKFLDPIKVTPSLKKINTGDKINLMVASGPYMSSSGEDWLLIDKLIENVKSNNATHIIMLGPFVDMENKDIRSQYDEKWQLLFGKLLEGLHDHECRIYLVPSMSRDILPAKLASNYYYPTSKFAIDIKLRDGVVPKCLIMSVDDPSQIDLGGIFVDVTSAEVLFHLHKCTSFINRGTSNVFDSLYKHILTHGIYPIYPGPPTMTIDYLALSAHTKIDRLAPHIIILPTKFSTSINHIEDRLVVTIHKCSVKKHVIMIEIPRIESSEDAPIKSLSEVPELRHEIVELVETSSQVKGEPMSEDTPQSQMSAVEHQSEPNGVESLIEKLKTEPSDLKSIAMDVGSKQQKEEILDGPA